MASSAGVTGLTVSVVVVVATQLLAALATLACTAGLRRMRGSILIVFRLGLGLGLRLRLRLTILAGYIVIEAFSQLPHIHTFYVAPTGVVNASYYHVINAIIFAFHLFLVLVLLPFFLFFRHHRKVKYRRILTSRPPAPRPFQQPPLACCLWLCFEAQRCELGGQIHWCIENFYRATRCLTHATNRKQAPIGQHSKTKVPARTAKGGQLSRCSRAPRLVSVKIKHDSRTQGKPVFIAPAYHR